MLKGLLVRQDSGVPVHVCWLLSQDSSRRACLARVFPGEVLLKPLHVQSEVTLQDLGYAAVPALGQHFEGGLERCFHG